MIHNHDFKLLSTRIAIVILNLVDRIFNIGFSFCFGTDPEIFGGLKPQSQYVSFPNLVARVSNHLKPSQMFLLLKSYRVYQVSIH